MSTIERTECTRCGGYADPDNTLPFAEYRHDNGENPTLCPTCRDSLVDWIEADGDNV